MKSPLIWPGIVAAIVVGIAFCAMPLQVSSDGDEELLGFAREVTGPLEPLNNSRGTCFLASGRHFEFQVTVVLKRDDAGHVLSRSQTVYFFEPGKSKANSIASVELQTTFDPTTGNESVTSVRTPRRELVFGRGQGWRTLSDTRSLWHRSSSVRTIATLSGIGLVLGAISALFLHIARSRRSRHYSTELPELPPIQTGTNQFDETGAKLA